MKLKPPIWPSSPHLGRSNVGLGSAEDCRCPYPWDLCGFRYSEGDRTGSRGFIATSKIKMITAPLVRELVDAKLVERGLEQARKMHTRWEILSMMSISSSSIPIKRMPMSLMDLRHESHLGWEDQEGICPAFCLLSGNCRCPYAGWSSSPRSGLYRSLTAAVNLSKYIKRFGLSLPNSIAMGQTCQTSRSVACHMVKFAAALQSHFAGAIVGTPSTFFSHPMSSGCRTRIGTIGSNDDLRISQQAVARGGQAIFTDLNLYWEIPKHFENVPAIGPGGNLLERLHWLLKESNVLSVHCLTSIKKEMDPEALLLPKTLVHITENSFKPWHMDFLHHICEVASEKGILISFSIVERQPKSLNVAASVLIGSNGSRRGQTTWKMRYCALQNVTLNLPRIAYLAKGMILTLFQYAEFSKWPWRRIWKKKLFIEKLLSLGRRDPSVVAMIGMVTLFGCTVPVF